MIKTQYFCEEIDAETGMFGQGRRSLMQGDRPAQEAPCEGAAYTFLLDVPGQNEARMDSTADVETLHATSLRNATSLQNPGRDAAGLTIIVIDLSSLPLLQGPTYRAVKRL